MTTLQGAKLHGQEDKNIQIRHRFYYMPRAGDKFNENDRSCVCNHSKTCPVEDRHFS